MTTCRTRSRCSRGRRSRSGTGSAGADDVTGDAAWRVYRLVPEAAWTRSDDTEGGQAVSARTPIPLDELRA